VPAFDSSRPLALQCRSLVGSGRPVERELDSQPGNRCSTARGLQWPAQALDTPACGAAWRSRVCSTFTSVGRKSARGSDSSELLGDRRRPGSWKAGTIHVVRREAVRSGRQKRVGFRGALVEKADTPRKPDDRKRAPRHEARRPPVPRESPGAGNRVKLGFSVFEKWVVCRMVRPHLAGDRGSLTGARLSRTRSRPHALDGA
jgi:hypothetical protein